MKKYQIIAAFILAPYLIRAQETFVQKGKITFEKRVNMVRTLESETWLSDDYKDKMKKYRLSNWVYAFTSEKSLFKQGEKDPANNSFYFYDSATGSIFTDFLKSSRIMQKNVSEVDYLLNDTIPKLDWKIQQDIRVIAGFECRKAVARFNDTVYAVAFYTDKIVPQGGPEGFTGLPGMILGLAIPRYFTTWFATKVEILPESSLDLKAPVKGEKIITDKDFNKMVDIYLRWNDEKKKPGPEEIKRRIYGLTL